LGWPQQQRRYLGPGPGWPPLVTPRASGHRSPERLRIRRQSPAEQPGRRCASLGPCTSGPPPSGRAQQRPPAWRVPARYAPGPNRTAAQPGPIGSLGRLERVIGQHRQLQPGRASGRAWHASSSTCPRHAVALQSDRRRARSAASTGSKAAATSTLGKAHARVVTVRPARHRNQSSMMSVRIPRSQCANGQGVIQVEDDNRRQRRRLKCVARVAAQASRASRSDRSV
jgi:hypothetical protein